jgi:hypothetical protein
MSVTDCISGWPGCIRLAIGAPTRQAHVLLLEADALVAAQHRVGIAAVAAGDLAVALADDGRDVGDLEAPGSRGRSSPPSCWKAWLKKERMK